MLLFNENVPQKMSSKNCKVSELFRFEDPKTCFSVYFFKHNFDKFDIIE